MSEFRRTMDNRRFVFGQATLEIAGCDPIPVYNLEIRTETPFSVVFEEGRITARMRANEPSVFSLEFQLNSKALHSGHLWFVRYTKENHIRYSLRICELDRTVNGELSLIGIETTAFESMTYKFEMRGQWVDNPPLPETIPRTPPKFIDGRPVLAYKQETPKPKPKRKVSFD